MKFSICDLLLVTVIVALAVGWFLDRQKHAKLTASSVASPSAASPNPTPPKPSS